MEHSNGSIRTTKKLAVMDNDTGEIITEVFFWGKPKTDHGFVKVFNAFLESVVENNELCGKAIRLLLYMIKRLDYNTLQVIVDIDEAMQELKITRRTYNNWIKALINHGLISKIKPYKYQLKPYSIVRGSMEKVKKQEEVVR